MLTPRLWLYVATLVVGMGAIGGLWAYSAHRYAAGITDGRRAMAEEITMKAARARLQSIEDARALRNEIDQLSEDDLVRRALGFLRPSGGSD